MKQKGKRAGRRLASLLLTFAMIVGMLSGPVFVKQTAQAAGEGTIELGTLENHGTYYTYPNAKVKMSDESKKFYDMTVLVDSGYFKIPHSQMDGVKGTGILTDGKMDSFDKFENISQSSQYSAVMFTWRNGITKSKIEEFISRISFSTTGSSSQVVSISATTMNGDEQIASVNGKNIFLKYFNGHFYGFVDTTVRWADAYKFSKTSDFHGVKGYLATITSRAEDRFIYSNWGSLNSWSYRGWLGCTRAKLADGSSYSDVDTKWKPLDKINDSSIDLTKDFVWRWVSGPESGESFGYQNHAYGQTHRDDGKWDGGFVSEDGKFSNWGNSNNVEPNGGGETDEAFGYYGQYEEGRWNDYDASQSLAFYIEFGGNPGDDKTLKDALGDVIYSATKDSADDGDGIIDDGKGDREKLRGDVEILNRDPYGNCTAGSPLEADIADILDSNANWDLDPEQDLTYQWYTQENEGVPVPIDGATEKTYILTDDDLGKKIIVWVTVEKEDEDGEMQKYTAESPALNTSAKQGQTVEIGGVVAIEKIDEAANGDPILNANIDGITPEGVKPVLDYQWYIYDPEKEGTGESPYTKIDGATDPTYTVPVENQGKQLVVTVTPNPETGEGYDGAVTSVPYTVVEKNTPKTPISGVLTIENQTLDDEGNPINKTGTVLSANIDGIEPEGAKPTLTYQWWVTDDDGVLRPIPGATDPNYILTEEDLDRYVAVRVSGDEVEYTGTVSALPYNTARTNADITIDPDPGVDPGDGKRIIKITPTADSTGYTIWEFISQQVPPTGTGPGEMRVTDKDGNELSPDNEGYYMTSPGEEIWFYVDKDKAYDIKEKQIIHSNTETIGTRVDDPKVDYDPASDTITITVDPAKPDYQYALLKKVDGKWDPVSVSRDDNGNYVFDKDSTTVWSDGDQEVVTYTKLPADGVYRIVAIPTATTEDGRNPDDIDPSKVNDGSKEIDATIYPTDSTPIDDPKTNYDPASDTITIAVDPAKTDYQYAILKKINGKYEKVTLTVDANGNYVYDEKGTTVWSNGNQGVVTFTKLPADGTYRIVAVSKTTAENKDVDPSQLTNGGSKDIDGSKVKQNATANQNPGVQYTKEEEDKAEKFIKDYVTDTKKKLITKVDDSTRDIIISGESTWKKMTDREKAAVNAKLKERGCPYTYEQLLEMAKKWKIPSFNMKKVMKKGTKSKIKMVKCNGATIVTTTSNKKVGTISKKGVIKAKKVGKAKLTITAIKGKYTNRLVIRLVVRKKFKNAKEIKKLKAKQIKTPTLLLNKQRKLKKSTKIGIVDLNKKSKVKYKSFNKKNFTINKKGRYKAKRLGSSLIRTTVKQNGKTYILYLYLTGIK